MQKELLTRGNIFKRTDGRWCGVVWYKDSQGERKRKSFSGTSKQEVSRKIKDYVNTGVRAARARRNSRSETEK